MEWFLEFTESNLPVLEVVTAENVKDREDSTSEICCEKRKR